MEANWNGIVRPPGYPGQQKRNLVVPQDGCVNDTSAYSLPLLRRCWPARLFLEDVATAGLDSDSTTGRTKPNNIIIVTQNVTVLCRRVVDEACIKQHTHYGCMMLNLGTNASTAATATAATTVATPVDRGAPTANPPQLPTSSNGVGGQQHAVLRLSSAGLAGAVCGAVTGLILLLLALMLLAAAVRRRWQRATRPSVTTSANPCRMSSTSDESAPVVTLGMAPPATTTAIAVATSAVDASLATALASERTIASGLGKSASATDCWLLESEMPVTLLTPAHGDLDLGVEIVSQGEEVAGSNLYNNCAVAAAKHPSPANGLQQITSKPVDQKQSSAGLQQQQEQRLDGREGSSSDAYRADLGAIERLSASSDDRLMPPRNTHHKAISSSGGSSISKSGGGGGRLLAGPANLVNDSCCGKDGDFASTAADNGGGGGRMSSGGVVTLLPVVRGKGAFGRVVEGVYGGQRVAVKILAGCATDSHQQAYDYNGPVAASFAQEVQVLGRCRHPNVVHLLAACVTPPRLCLVMELMETSLERLLYGGEVGGGGAQATDGGSKEGPPQNPLLPLPKVLHIATSICRALAFLHPTITHRDVKPANVLLNDPWGDKPVVKLSDFGLARLRDTVAVTKTPDAGTPAYMAPECFDISCGVITHKADMYSLGVLLWEMLSGNKPWAGFDVIQIGLMVSWHNRRLALSTLPISRCSVRLHMFLGSCWERDPARRPAAAEAANELAAIAEAVAAAATATATATARGGAAAGGGGW